MLTIEQHGPVLQVKIARPEVRNAFNEEVITGLYQTFTTVSDAIRVVVISGVGPAFCAGGDLDWMRRAAGFSAEENERDALRLARTLQAVQGCHALTIASVHGAAFGGGCGLVAACDIAIATQETKFAFSEVKLGLIPATISPFVIHKIGPGHARALFATGEVFDAERAFRIGLIHEVVSASERDASVRAKVRAALSAGPNAIAGAKQLVFDAPLSAEETAKRLAATRATQEAKEGIAAFLEKRSASYVQSLED